MVWFRVIYVKITEANNVAVLYDFLDKICEGSLEKLLVASLKIFRNESGEITRLPEAFLGN